MRGREEGRVFLSGLHAFMYLIRWPYFLCNAASYKFPFLSLSLCLLTSFLPSFGGWWFLHHGFNELRYSVASDIGNGGIDINGL